ncbi:hypothetical protein ACWERY_29750 [Streptomyces sp. NPDC004082]|uniref:hypothetical protein n=1 Tax=Streptomyces sp. NPDC005568 TaxID=3156887 RepID=UPI0033A77884
MRIREFIDWLVDRVLFALRGVLILFTWVLGGRDYRGDARATTEALPREVDRYRLMGRRFDRHLRYLDIPDVGGADRRAELYRAAQEAARWSAEDSWAAWAALGGESDDGGWWVVPGLPPDVDDTLPPEDDDPLSPEEELLAADQTADAMNLTLARLFVRLGPPPADIGGTATPVASGDGGSAR